MSVPLRAGRSCQPVNQIGFNAGLPVRDRIHDEPGRLAGHIPERARAQPACGAPSRRRSWVPFERFPGWESWDCKGRRERRGRGARRDITPVRRPLPARQRLRNERTMRPRSVPIVACQAAWFVVDPVADR